MGAFVASGTRRMGTGDSARATRANRGGETKNRSLGGVVCIFSTRTLNRSQRPTAYGLLRLYIKPRGLRTKAIDALLARVQVHYLQYFVCVCAHL
jgi:hypothetical protein